jgi:hypothetical protein
VSENIYDNPPGLVLDIPGHSDSNGTAIWQWKDLGGTNQEWLIISYNGNFAIASVWDGKVLDDPGFSTTPGARIQQWSDWGGDNQRWNIVSLGGAYMQVGVDSKYSEISVWGSGLPPGTWVDFTYIGVPNMRCKTQAGSPSAVTVAADGSFRSQSPPVWITSDDPNCRADFGVTVVAEDPQGNVPARLDPCLTRFGAPDLP